MQFKYFPGNNCIASNEKKTKFHFIMYKGELEETFSNLLTITLHMINERFV